MIEAGINDKDVFVVDRSLEPQNNKIAICFIDGEFTAKRIQLEKDFLYLIGGKTQLSPHKSHERKPVNHL
jgi:DNA polymerase V